ncbi:DUF2927 domain-containing protein [Anianabacter salinae]|uniref:DUF2927 domain-containing protein n=1 Tax=Anianabacter salinae TaxID=2851023 RepID=UPI00225E373D|nr:DUF2927 domain-containing protein [Anianabacter salinae]MBV0913901.1 DUF2927 domain-containing protein [Anianabacter salinae]
MRAAFTGGTILAAALALAACAPLEAPRQSPRPSAADRPAEATDQTGTAIVAQSARSRLLERYYTGVQNDLISQGLLRTDGGGPDVPVSRRQLVDNFIKIALFEEFSNVGGAMVQRQTETRLHRWEQPVRLNLEFGASVPQDQRVRDENAVRAYASRLGRITGHPITFTDQSPNFHVLVLNEDERQTIGPRLREIVPALSSGAIRTIENIPRATFCLVFAIDPANDSEYGTAVAIIRGEHPELLRLSCFHEEIAQGLGLSNDSPAARPSIFNDDEEFGLLTTMDEMMLKMLYDPRLRPRMTAATVRPIAQVMASELLGGDS